MCFSSFFDLRFLANTAALVVLKELYRLLALSTGSTLPQLAVVVMLLHKLLVFDCHSRARTHLIEGDNFKLVAKVFCAVEGANKYG